MTERPATRLNAVTSLVSRNRDMASSDASNEATTPSQARRPPSVEATPRVPSVRRKGEPMARPSKSLVGQPPDAPVEALVFGRVDLTTTFDETDGRLTREGSDFEAPVTASTRPA